MKKLLIFDFDGTLADSLPGIHAAINLMAREMGYPERVPGDVKRAIGNGAKNLVYRLIPAEAGENPQTFAAAFACYERMYDAASAENTALFAGIAEMTAALRGRGYTLAILSNKQERHLRGLVEAMFEPGVISFALGQTDSLPLKPDPAAVRHIMRKLAFSERETALIGDSSVDLQNDVAGLQSGFGGFAAGDYSQDHDTLGGGDVHRRTGFGPHTQPDHQFMAQWAEQGCQGKKDGIVG